jgi:membrane protease YdiL (CAAX protease family)
MDAQLNKKRILIFLAFAFGIPWIASLALTLSPMYANNPAQAQSLANTIAISTPWLAALVARLITKEGWKNLWLRPNFGRTASVRGGWRFYLAAWLLPLLAISAGGTAFYLLFPQSFDPNLNVLMKMVEGNPAVAGINPWMILLSSTISMMIITVPVNTVVSLGEEFGWRAYLLLKLVERFAGSGASYAVAARKAALLVGVIHGVWHWPLILMAATFTPGFTIFTLPVYLVFTCALSMLLSWVTLRSGSVWPAAIGHGAANPTSNLPMYMLNGSPISLIGPEVTGLIGGIGYTILALVLLFSRGAFAGKEKRAGAEIAPAAIAHPG